MKFERLVVIGLSGRSASNNLMWMCECKCGENKVISGSNLRTGRTRSCGCLSRELSVSVNTKHGHAKIGKVTREYRCWQEMKKRCTNPNSHAYPDYGGRGIQIYEPWLNSFNEFISHIGPCPNSSMSIGRIDNNLGYQPGNVAWATPREQSLNRRSNLLITFNGKTQPAALWADELGINRKIIYWRAARGWTHERILTTPVKNDTIQANL